MNEESQKIADLRQKQKQAISILDFASAKQIDQEIEHIKAGSARKNAQSIYQPTLDQLESYLQKFDITAEEKRVSFFKEEKFIRAKYDSKFTEAKSRHMKMLTEIQLKQVKAILKERSRPVPEYEEMLRNAQKAAAIGNYDLAEEIRERSSQVAQLAFDQREQVVNDKFEALQQNALETMSIEIQNLVTMLERGLANVQTKKAHCLNELYRLREQHVISLHQQFTQFWTKQTPIAKRCAPVEPFNAQFEEILNRYDCPIPHQLLVIEKRIGPQLTPKSLKNLESTPKDIIKRSPSPMRNRSPSPGISRSQSPSTRNRSPYATPSKSPRNRSPSMTPSKSPSTPKSRIPVSPNRVMSPTQRRNI